MANPALALAAHPEPTAPAFPVIGDLVLVARCDSVAQRAAWAELGPVAAKRELVGLLRVVALLGSRVLLTHAHVLDGVVLLEMGPYELARELGVAPADLPIKVSAIDGSLRVALDCMYARDEFVWSSQLAFTDRMAAAQRQDLAARDAADGDDRHSVAQTRIPQQAATLADIERHLLDLREQWIEFLEANPNMMLVSPKRVEVCDHLGTPPDVSESLAPLIVELSTAQDRSVAWRALERARQDGLGSAEEREALLRWMLDGHATATAVQHDVAWIAATPAEPRRRWAFMEIWQPLRKRKVAAAPETLRLSHRSLKELRDVPPGLFELFRFRVNQLYRSGYRVVVDPELLVISYVITTGLQVPDRREYVRRLWRSLLWLGALAIAAAVVTALSVNMTGVILVAMVVLVLVQSLPFEHFKAVWDLHCSESGMTVHLTAKRATQALSAASAAVPAAVDEDGERADG